MEQNSLGRHSAVLAAFFSLTYVFFQLAEWLGYLGSAGGPESTSTPLGLILLLTPSILLAPCFIIVIIALHNVAPPSRRVWGQASVAFATIYGTLICFVYYVQLTLVLPRTLEGRVDDLALLLFVPFDSFLYSVDLLGYSFMSLATLFSGISLKESKNLRTARFFLLANGWLLPFLLFQIYITWLIYLAAFWAVTFPAAMISIARAFRAEDSNHA